MNMEDDWLGQATLEVKRWPKETIAAGRRHTVGFKYDGTAMAVGDNKYELLFYAIHRQIE